MAGRGRPHSRYRSTSGHVLSDPRRSVLVTEGLGGESRAAVAAVRALAAEGYRPAVTVSGNLSLAASSRYCTRRVPVPIAEDSHYASAIRKEMLRGDYLTVLPLSDPAVLALDNAAARFLNKVETADLARSVGIPVAPARVFARSSELAAVAEQLDYPVVVKPSFKRYAAAKVTSADELRAALVDDGAVIMQPYLREQFHAVAGLVWQGTLKAAVHMRYLRLWPLPCGTVASAETTEPDLELEEQLSELLSGHSGIFHAEFAGGYLQDLNPRVHATLPLAVASGVNLVSIYCDLLRGEESRVLRGRPGMFFRWVEGDFRSILRQLRSGGLDVRCATRAMRPRPGAIHSYESLSDPGPMFARARFAWRRLKLGPPRPGQSTFSASL